MESPENNVHRMWIAKNQRSQTQNEFKVCTLKTRQYNKTSEIRLIFEVKKLKSLQIIACYKTVSIEPFRIANNIFYSLIFQ